MFDKPVEYWVAILTGAAIVVERHKGKPWYSRIMLAGISAGIGSTVAPDLAQWTGRSETIALMLSTAFGYLVLDIALSILADRDFVKDVVRARYGGGKQ